jgi:multicomponent Na+:H+ antiporter subunit E
VSAAAALVRRLRPLFWLVLVWMLLWGGWSWADLLSGVLVALAVTTVLPLPPVAENVRIRPVALAVLVAVFARDLAVSSVQVAAAALRPRGPVRSAFAEVRLRTDSDLLLTLLAEMLTLIPGSIVLGVDRERRTLALHLLDTDDPADVEREKAFVLAAEDRLVRALGSADDIAALRGGARR